MVYSNILEAVGHTPMVRLNRMVPAGCAEVFVKFEGLNVGGSIKTRTALNMVEDAERRGLLQPDTVIVEPTSGNQGIGLALCGAVKGYAVKIIMPDSVSEERRKLVQHYAKNDPKVFVPGQFDNPANPAVHRHHTATEILEQVGAPIDGFCSGFGTGGTISGIGEVLKAQNPQLEIWAVEPENAAILSGGSIGTHLQMGIGDGIIPRNLNTKIYDHLYIVTDEEALRTAKDLARLEGLMCGISSGTNVAAAIQLAKKLGTGKTVVTVLPDTAERYFSTPLFAEN